MGIKPERKTKHERPILMYLFRPGKPVPELIFGYFSAATQGMCMYYGEDGLTLVRRLG